MSKVYAVDVDNTLNIPSMPYPGPVDIRDLYDLKNRGSIVGICGNYYIGFKFWPDVWKVINFWGPLLNHDKATFLATIKADISRTQPQYREFVMVGNRHMDAVLGHMVNGRAVLPSSNDDGVARLAGWKFISETDFSLGRR